ncbi:hypothetical protein BEK98_45045 [Streptomyces diastatochromogenes]|uniref:Uncharacterized protein n=1 Tax=Streptomyces diastatochromogenes TaxID=42236 RepID=A0A233RRK8_STRDA|nr:hypothetical protein [Streptomyces diastatochromogenes]OXY86015.1 hypothetical protein BEK98_45045 [Streptomyces diastatochromogenes]
MDGDLLFEDAGPPAFCDLCRACIAPGQAVSGQVRDSSFAHPVDPHQDGDRMVISCCVDHLAELQRRFRERPFVAEELWVAKIDQVMQRHHVGLSNEQLVRETGLNLVQLEAAARWCLGVGPPVDGPGADEG